MRESLRSLRLLVSTILHADRPRAVGVAVSLPIGYLAQPLYGVWLKVLADGAVKHSERSVITGAIGLAGFVGLRYLGGWLGERLQMTLGEKVGFEFDRQLAELSALAPSIEHFERPDYLDRIELLRERRGELPDSAWALAWVLTSGVMLIGTLVILGRIDLTLLVLPAFGVPSLVASRVVNRRMIEAENEGAPAVRLARHLFELGVRSGPAKELRVFRLENEITSRHAEAWWSAERRRQRVRARAALWAAFGSLSFVTGFIGAIALVTWKATLSRATPGDVLLAITVVAQVNGQLSWFVSNMTWFQSALRSLSRFSWLKAFANDAADKMRGSQIPPSKLDRGIVLDSVRFAYPDAADSVIQDVSLKLPAGRVIALVGENGAGKTTLVKLLCRLYDVSAGGILVDGIDLRELNVELWRARVAVGFQDFVRFELLAGEAVGIGDLPRIGDEVAIEGALERAGAQELVADLPVGLRTQLGRQWDAGVDLSQGQWQKLALGRALMRDRPLLRIFDEPTSALDAQAEHSLFERYAESARARTEEGTITLLVSHRFSTVKTADIIVVLDRGGVLDIGDHSALMARGGLYAELYEIQHRAYL